MNNIEKNIKAIIKDYLYNSANFYIVIIWLKHGWFFE